MDFLIYEYRISRFWLPNIFHFRTSNVSFPNIFLQIETFFACQISNIFQKRKKKNYIRYRSISNIILDCISKYYCLSNTYYITCLAGIIHFKTIFARQIPHILGITIKTAFTHYLPYNSVLASQYESQVSNRERFNHLAWERFFYGSDWSTAEIFSTATR